MLMRVDKIIASTGMATRSEVKTMVRRGQVTADGVVVKSAQEKYDPETTQILVSGEQVSFRFNHYYMMNKPAGYVTSTEDARDQTVMDLLPQELQRQGLFPAGRLDKDSEGLLILTNDGDLAHRIMSPRHKVGKLYYVETEQDLEPQDISAFKDGIVLGDGYRCQSAVLKILSHRSAHVIIREGKYHQVKRMLASRGKPVVYLKRLRIGALELDESLEKGQCRELTPEEIAKLYTDQ